MLEYSVSKVHYIHIFYTEMSFYEFYSTSFGPALSYSGRIIETKTGAFPLHHYIIGIPCDTQASGLSPRSRKTTGTPTESGTMKNDDMGEEKVKLAVSILILTLPF